GTNCCNPGQKCCGFPSYICNCLACDCPISRRAYKTDIRYLTEDEERTLRDELVRFPLASYRYKTEEASDREHLGFIIDDVEPTAAADSAHDAVDLYGYATMSVAALKQQAREIEMLHREVETLRRELEARDAANVHAKHARNLR